MKRLIIILLFIFVIPVINQQADLFGNSLFFGIRNSHHDFSGAAWNGDRICRPCHIPHNANTDVPDSPLWNHENTTATFQVFNSPTLDSSPGQPTGRTKLCLSCHDGTVAVENHGGYNDGTRYTTWGNLSTDLSNDHPVSFIYDTPLSEADGGLYDPNTTVSGLGGTINDDMLNNGMMGCTSCHDVHVSRNTQGCMGCHNMHTGRTRTLSLRITMDGSQLCLSCHKK